MISLIIPSYNNLNHLQNAYNSIKKHAPEAEIILLDDGSTDGTWEWIQRQDCIKFKSDDRIGHTILYDKGIELATNKIVGILHADMIIGPNYIKNLLKHLKPKTVICATRIEPPLHPPGKEKIIHNFGIDFNSLDIEAFEKYCIESQENFQNQISKGMFAPWILYKEDFQAIGGHDPLFAPFPYEDSDLFQRWILNGYTLIQSRDAFVYHLTCRGHRWNEQIGKNDDYYILAEAKARKNYFRKWKSWIKNDEYQYPIITPVYDIGYVVHNCTLSLLEILEPLCNNIYIDDQNVIDSYINLEQKNTIYNLNKKIFNIKNNQLTHNDILIEFNANDLTNHNILYLYQFPEIFYYNQKIGYFTADIYNINIKSLQEYQSTLIINTNHEYKNI